MLTQQRTQILAPVTDECRMQWRDEDGRLFNIADEGLFGDAATLVEQML